MTGGSKRHAAAVCCERMRIAMTILVYAEIDYYRESDKPSGQALSTSYAIV